MKKISFKVFFWSLFQVWTHVFVSQYIVKIFPQKSFPQTKKSTCRLKSSPDENEKYFRGHSTAFIYLQFILRFLRIFIIVQFLLVQIVQQIFSCW